MGGGVSIFIKNSLKYQVVNVDVDYHQQLFIIKFLNLVILEVGELYILLINICVL